MGLTKRMCDWAASGYRRYHGDLVEQFELEQNIATEDL
jgi:hypothetical protein